MPDWQIVDIDKVPTRFRNPFIVRLPGKDLKKALKGAKEARQPAGPSGGLLLIPNPDGDVDIYPVCPDAGPETVCKVDMAPSFGGVDGVTWTCQCRKKVRTPGRVAPPPAKTCRLQLSAEDRRLRCVSDGCLDCRMEFTPIKIGGATLYLIRCRCAD